MEDQRLRVMHVTSDLEIGGAQEVVRTLVEHQLAEGCLPVVCTFADGPLRTGIERLGIPVEMLPDRRHGVLNVPLFVRDLLQARSALMRLARKYEVDVVQTHLLWSQNFLVLSLRLGRTRPVVFWTAQNERLALRADQLPGRRWLLRPKMLGYRLLYSLTQRWAGGFVAVSDRVASAIQRELGGSPEKIAIIHNAVDLGRYGRGGREADRLRVRSSLGLGPASRLAITVATLKPQKGHRYLIEAAQALVSEFPDLHFAFVGDGELREELLARVRALGLAERVHFLGSRGDVSELLAASDLFVLPSLWEGLPMALIESMASGLPVVATDVSGTEEVVTSGETGLLVPPGDAVALAGAIARLLTRPDEAQALANAARARVAANFGAAKQAREHIALYRRELGRRVISSRLGRWEPQP